MKKLLSIAILLLLTNCNSVEIIDSWKNPDIATFESTKILIVGMTSNVEARRKFESKLKEERFLILGVLLYYTQIILC